MTEVSTWANGWRAISAKQIMTQKTNPESQLKRRTYITWDTVAQKKKMERYAREKGLPLGTWLKTLAIEEVNLLNRRRFNNQH